MSIVLFANVAVVALDAVAIGALLDGGPSRPGLRLDGFARQVFVGVLDLEDRPRRHVVVVAAEMTSARFVATLVRGRLLPTEYDHLVVASHHMDLFAARGVDAVAFGVRAPAAFGVQDG